ncbi:MAG: NUDIX hydrolase [Planctomycetota bacterium]
MAFDLHPESEVVHEGVRVTLRAAELDAGGGRTRRREVVEAADAVVVLPLITADEAAAAGLTFSPAELSVPGVVLIENDRFAVRQTLWELPAGTVEPGEATDATAGRELTEETGYRAERVTKLTAFYPTPGFCTELLHAYRAEGLTLVGQSLDETERITPHVVPWAEAIGMVRDGTIRDAKTIATLLYHEAFGRRPPEGAPGH